VRSHGAMGPASPSLLDYDVVLNVELIVHVHNVYFHALLVLPSSTVCLLLVGGHDSLDMEELLFCVISSDKVVSVSAAALRIPCPVRGLNH